MSVKLTIGQPRKAKHEVRLEVVVGELTRLNKTWWEIELDMVSVEDLSDLLGHIVGHGYLEGERIELTEDSERTLIKASHVRRGLDSAQSTLESAFGITA